jgi:hypothetical protein
MRRMNPFAAAVLGAVVALIALVALPGLGIGETTTSHGASPSDVFTNAETEVCAEVPFGEGSGAMFTPVTFDQESHLLVYFTFEGSGFGPRTELLLGPELEDEAGDVVQGRPFEWGFVGNAAGAHTSGTVMWTFEDVPAGSYIIAMTHRVETVPSGLPGGNEPSAVMENCVLTVFVNPVA